ncbi:anaphase-promoting complex, cyclosome, subunit 4-domain-containing protein [Scheffersomyces coipomensis]|uniref:anaphase-promoting complex, cyclosome, subunit 4-domain-containing protein n=1 Tax=Scheffersomyces coipomensis TaxID=1788519 RepID=UPI00315DCA08
MTISLLSPAHKFLGLVDESLINWCPTLNLITVVINKTSVWVYRLNGERIYSVNNKSPILSITFMKNGLFFCLAGVDGKIKIYDSNNGKLIKILSSTFDQIKLINWNFHTYKSYHKFDDLFKVNVLENLPSLSSEVGDNIDINNNSNDLNFLTIIDSQRLCINFNNLLIIDDISLASNIEFKDHLNNNDLFNQYFLIQNQDHDDDSLQLLQWNIAVENKKILIDIILKFCKIINYLNYIDSQLQQCHSKVTPFLQLYDRYLSNLKDSIEEDDIMIYLFDLLLTNLIPEETKDFWLNQFGERGYKKLIKLGSNMYDGLREVLFIQIVSCLERLCILFNDLYSISKWLKDSNSNDDTFGLNPLIINGLLNHIKVFLKRIYKLIWIINKEQELFNNFINWIKNDIIDKILSSTGKDCVIKEHDIILYLNNHCFNSGIWQYFDLNLSDCDILRNESNPKLLVDSYNLLNTEFNEKLLIPFSKYFKSHLNFEFADFPIKLSLESKLHYINESHSIILTRKDSSLQILEFSYSNPIKAITKELNFNQQINKEILSYQVYDNKILILLKTEIGYDISRVIIKNSNEFEIETVSCNSGTRLPDPQKLALNAEFGCILDGNNQNYMVFKH